MVLKRQRVTREDRTAWNEEPSLSIEAVKMEERLAQGERDYKDIRDEILDDPESRAIYVQEMQLLRAQMRTRLAWSPWKRMMYKFRGAFPAFWSKSDSPKPKPREPVE